MSSALYSTAATLWFPVKAFRVQALAMTGATPLLRPLRSDLARLGDPERARGQQAYAKSAMPFHGVTAPQLRAVCRRLFAPLDWPDARAWRRDVLGIWRGATHREERHAAIELSGHRRARPFQTLEALPVYQEMIVTGAWWDFVDGIATHRLRELLVRYPAPMRRTMRAWARDANMWKRRAAILCQIGLKEKTDLGLLYACIEPSLDSKEFFLRKGIGWALRQYAWTDPEEIVGYVRANRDRLSPLSRREALKNVLKQGLITRIP
jgi:3-methyladenine DNA glycosylase AlkD